MIKGIYRFTIVNQEGTMKKIILRFIVVLLIVYLVGVGIFTMITFPNTYIGGVEKSYVRMEDAFNRNPEARTLIIHGRNGKELQLKALDFSYTESVKSGEVIQQNQFLWPLAWLSKHEHNPEYNYNYSEQQLEDFIGASTLMQDNKQPQNAVIVLQDDAYIVQPSEPGDTLIKTDAAKSILQAFLDGKEELTLDQEYMKPEVTEEDPSLIKKAEEINKIHKLKLTYSFGEDKEVLEGDRLLDMFRYTGEGYEPIYDQVHEYLRQLAIKYDTYGPSNERKFMATGIGEITVQGGIYGWQMDVEESAKELVTALMARESKEMTPIYLNEGLEPGLNDIGNTYIEIDLNRQHLWFYKGGELITDTNIVSGDPTRGVATPTGVGKVWSREKDRSLVGIVPEGSADYSSYVDFWMPVNWSGVGIHNSRWRTSFGGGIYNGSGSYGCINLPYDPTKLIFDNVEINTPVVIY